ncbi:MAG TPA: histidine phosphatase family protein [Ktedonobacteraceae bacterium]|nr:histidine phosphatase family protein [Ktedonobacteraceae bacterium]
MRHGLTGWNLQQRYCGHSDIPLAAQGRQQALWVAEQLQQASIAAIYTSDLLRARETAEIIAGRRTQVVQIKVSAAWREMDFGAWEGLTYTQIVEQFKDHLAFFTDPEHHAPPHGESLLHLKQRVTDALSAMLHDNASPAGDIVIVSHGGPLRILLCSLLGMSLSRQWQLRLDPGSISAIDLPPGSGILSAAKNDMPRSHNGQGSCHSERSEESEPRAILALLNVQAPFTIRS